MKVRFYFLEKNKNNRINLTSKLITSNKDAQADPCWHSLSHIPIALDKINKNVLFHYENIN